MFSTTVHIVLAGLLLSAPAAFAVPGLSLHISGPKTVEGIENLKLVVAVNNTGDETLKLLNDPRGLLSTMPTHKFIIRNVAGEEPLFIGAMVKYVPADHAAVAKDEEDFTVLAPGDSVSVEHDLSKAYNFTFPGAGLYTFEAHNLFYYINTSAAIPIYAHTLAHESFISGRLVVRGANLVFSAKLAAAPTFFGCNDHQKAALSTAISDATTYLQSAVQYMQVYKSPATRYTTWFGAYEQHRYEDVQVNLENLIDNAFPEYTSPYAFNCACTLAGYYAWVNPLDSHGLIHICPLFWKAPRKGTDSKFGILVHEASHFAGNCYCDDYKYGQNRCKGLARTDPSKAIQNADSYQYFIENHPSLP